MKEYREFPRLHASCDLNWRVIDDAPGALRPSTTEAAGEGDHVGGFLRNISGGGLCFSSLTPPAIGEMLVLRMGLPGVPAPVIALGCVKWLHDLHGTFDVGVEFWWVGWQDDGAQAHLGNFITHKLAEPLPVTKQP